MSPAARSDDWRISSRPFALGIAGPEVAEQEAGVALDRGEQVVEVVGDAAGEAAEHLHLLRLGQLALQPLPGADVARGDARSAPAPTSSSADWRPPRRFASSRPRAAAGTRSARRAPALAAIASQAASTASRVVGVEELGERSPDHLVQRPAEEPGQGGAREPDPPVGIEREDQIGGVLQQQPEPVLPLLVGGAQGLESRRHLGDRVGQDAEIVVTPDAGPGLQVARGHPAGGGDQPLAPPGPVSLQPEPDGEAERQKPEDSRRCKWLRSRRLFQFRPAHSSLGQTF